MIRFALAGPLFLVALGACTAGRSVNPDAPEIPTGQLARADALVVLPAVAAEGVSVSPGNLERLTRETQRRLGELALSRRVPPIFGTDSQFRAEHPAELRVRVISVAHTTRRGLGGLGRERPVVALGLEVQFADRISGEPLGEWAPVTEATGLAEGPTMNAALAEAARLIAAHVARDFTGR